MKTIAKVAIGCGIAVVLAGIAAIVALGGAAWWLKGKAESMAGDQAKIEALQKKADQHPFAPPEGGVLQEDHLVKFLEVRKRVFAVYQTHRAELEAMSEKKQADLSDVAKAFSWVNELRLAVAQAQADIGMSQQEYEYYVQNVYKTQWAAEIEKSTGKSASQALDEVARQTETAAGEAKWAAREQGAPEAAEQTEDALETAAAQMKKAAEEAKALDVPKANIELFRKYEADIKKYAMNGLELLGL